MINSTYKKANRLFYTILLVWIVQLGWAQIFPVQVNSNVLPPYLSSISKYSTTTDQKYLVNIFTSDLSVVNRQVKLKLYLQGNGINAQSAPVVVGASPLFINGGESLQLNNIDLAPYFELQNLQGINPLQYSGVLPQGNYNFCVEVYDFVTNQPISQKSCTFFYFIYNEPPLLNLPFNHEVILFQDPQNIIFTWTPRHINATNIEYQFELIELLDNQAPSNYAFIVGAPVWQETVNNTILNYNFNLPQLAAGKKYAWRVKAVSQPGFGEEAIFNNNGYSEIYDFIYAGNCSAPEFVLAQSTSATQAKIMWQTNTNHLANVVQYRKQGTQEWFNAPVANGQALLFDLEPTATYEFQVGGTCLGNITTFSAINQFTQPAKDQVAINCGIAPAIDLTNVTLYSEELQKDMVFMAADYAIHITESQGVGTYTGKGWTRAPYLKNIKIAVEFENIKLNSELKLVEGEVKAQYDPTWSNIVDVNQVIDTLDDIFDTLQESTDVHTHQVNFVIQDTTNIVVQNGQIIITTPQGTTGATFDFDQGENTTITDSNGTVYNVDPNGNVTLVQQGIGVPNSSNTENLNSNGEVTALSNVGAKVVFKNNTASIAFDDSSANYSNAPPKLAKQYKTIKDGSGNDYPFYYKAVINNEDGLKTTDLVTAEITITDTLIKPKDIVFNLKGQKVEEESSSTVGNVTTKVLKVPAFTTVGENELLALVKIKTDSLKQKVIGAMTVIPIKNVGTVNVTLVPVNGAAVTNDDIVAIQKIYSGAGVALNITIAPNHTDAITTLECGTSGWIANYTTEQNAFIDRYKAAKTISDTEYYVFVTKGIQPSRPLSGFMPLHRQYGFVFSDETGTGETKQTEGSRLATIIAHELGHGVFELEHPWEKYDYTVGAYTTNWLMDYASGKELPYRHWQQISHPKTKLYLFQGDSSGEQATVVNIEGLKEFANADGTYTFISRAGKPITVPSNITEVVFSTGDSSNCDQDINNPFRILPFGTLTSFKLQEKNYTARWDCVNNSFSGYTAGESDIYIDIITKIEIDKAIVGFPSVSSGKIIFKVGKLSITPEAGGAAYRASGNYEAFDFLASRITEINKFNEVYAQFDPTYDTEVKQFILDHFDQNVNFNNFYGNNAYLFIHATQLQKYNILKGCFKNGIPGRMLKYITKYVSNYQSSSSGEIQDFGNNVPIFSDTYEPETSNDLSLINYWKDFDLNYYPIIGKAVTDFKILDTSDAQDIVDLFNNNDVNNSPISNNWDCFWERLTIADKKNIIKVFANDGYVFSGYYDLDSDSEHILLKIFTTTTKKEDRLELLNFIEKYDYINYIFSSLDYNSVDSSLFIKEIFNWLREANPTVFSKETAEIKKQEFINWEQTINYAIIPNTYITDKYILYGANWLNETSEIYSDFEADLDDESGNAKIRINHLIKEDNSIVANKAKFKGEFNLYDPVFIYLSDNRFAEFNSKLTQDSYFIVPAIYIHWLDSSLDSNQNEAALRVAADVLAIALAPATAGGSTVILSIEVTAAVTDIIITTNRTTFEDTFGQEGVMFWDVTYGIWNLYTLGKSFGLFNFNTTTVNGLERISSFRIMMSQAEEIANSVAQHANLSDKLAYLSKIDELLNVLKTNKFNNVAKAHEMFGQLLEFRLKVQKSLGSSVNIVVDNGNLIIKNATSSNLSLGKIDFLNDIPTLTQNIRWLPTGKTPSSPLVVFENVGYIENGVTKSGILKIVEDAGQSGQFYLLPVSNSVSFINTLQTTHPILYQKFLSLNNNLKPKFVTDFELANTTTLNKLAANNGELVDVWKNVTFGTSSDVVFLRVWKNIINFGKIKHIYYGDIKLIIKSGGVEVFNKEYNATKFLTQELQNDLNALKTILNSNSALINNIKHNLKSNQLNAETDVIHLTLSGLHGGHYIDSANSTIFAQPGSSITYLERPNTGGLTYNPDPTIMPPVATTATVLEIPKGSALNDGTKASDIIPAAARVLDKAGWLQIKNNGTLPSLSESSKLIWLKKGNNADGLASIFPKLSVEETEELVAIAFASPSKVWNIDGNIQKWESIILFKGKNVTVQGYGINSGNPESDILNTGWINNID